MWWEIKNIKFARMNTFIKDKKLKTKFSHFFFHKSFRKNVPIFHIAATPLKCSELLKCVELSTPPNKIKQIQKTRFGKFDIEKLRHS